MVDNYLLDFSILGVDDYLKYWFKKRTAEALMEVENNLFVIMTKDEFLRNWVKQDLGIH